MAYELNEDDRMWLIQAIQKGMTKLEMKGKLTKARFDKYKIEAFVKEYELLNEKGNEEEEIIEKGKEKDDEASFEEEVKRYQNGEKLSWKEKREVKNFIKNVKKYTKTLKWALEKVQEAFNGIEENVTKETKEKNEALKELKEELIDRIIDSKRILEIEDPNTREEATKESLKKCTIPQLIQLMQDNVNTLETFINGKTEKEEEEDDE